MAVIVALIAFAPAIAFAQTGPTNGIVPCGYGGLPSCDLCQLYVLAKNGVDFMLFDLILPVAIIALLIGGIFLLASRGNPQMMETGKKAITNTVMGVIIAFAAWLIIATIANTLGYTGFTGAWNKAPTCQQSLVGQTPTGNPGTNPSPPPNPGTNPPPPPGGGTCTPVANGPCSESNLNGSCFGSGLANQASQICGAESVGDAGSESTRDRATGGNCPPPFQPNDCPHSAGLFQINLAKHSVGGLPCKDAFQPVTDNGVTRYRIVDQTLYSNCLAAAKIPATNITAACQVRNEAGGWGPWTVEGLSNKCGL